MFIAEMGTYGPGEIRVLSAPVSPELADLLNPDHVRTLLEQLRKSFDFIVVDTASHIDEFNLQTMEAGDRIIMVTSTTITGVKASVVMFKVLDALSIPKDRICLVVNHPHSGQEIPLDRIEGRLGTKVAVVIPHDPQVVSASIAAAKPFVIENRDSKIAGAFRDLVATLVPLGDSSTPEVDKKKKARFGFGR